MMRFANELSFSPPPRCPHCGIGIIAYGKTEPFAVDAEFRPYCREHGGLIDPAYPAASARYLEALKAFKRAAMRDLDEATATDPPGE